jgi:hypothetical protein
MLIIKCRNFISAETLNEIKHRIEEQAKEGTIVLPYYLDAIYVPNDTEIVFEDEARAKEKEKMRAIMKEDGTIIPLCENCQFKQCWGKIGETIQETFAEQFEKLVLNNWLGEKDE